MNINEYGFEICSKYADADLALPIRKTPASAGYDFQVADDVIIPSYYDQMGKIKYYLGEADSDLFGLDDIAQVTKETKAKPTLVPTGIKCHIPNDYYLELSVRSSSPLKYWLILANGVGIIDADYYNNPSNEGEIFFQVINLSPVDIILHKGDTIGQGIIKNYCIFAQDAPMLEEREGGFGSTDQQTTGA